MVLAAVGLLAAVLVGRLARQLRREFFPEVDAGAFEMYVRAPSGTRIEITEDRIAEVETVIEDRRQGLDPEPSPGETAESDLSSSSPRSASPPTGRPPTPPTPARWTPSSRSSSPPSASTPPRSTSDMLRDGFTPTSRSSPTWNSPSTPAA